MKLILDYSKWRCGANGLNKLGNGLTHMLNDEGYMCCLGQFSKQLNPEITDDEIKYEPSPAFIKKPIPLLNIERTNNWRYVDNTWLSKRAVNINDCAVNTPQEKIIQLRNLFRNEDCEIEVINQPETV